VIRKALDEYLRRANKSSTPVRGGDSEGDGNHGKGSPPVDLRSGVSAFKATWRAYQGFILNKPSAPYLLF